jgi:hypothetical protein
MWNTMSDNIVCSQNVQLAETDKSKNKAVLLNDYKRENLLPGIRQRFLWKIGLTRYTYL